MANTNRNASDPMTNAPIASDSETQEYQLHADHEVTGRLDKVLVVLTDFSRARLQSLIKAGNVKVNGIVEKAVSAKVGVGEKISVTIPPLVASIPEAQDIPLDIVYEDDDLMIINKPAGLVVHPGAGNPDGTLVNAILHHCKDQLSGIGGVMRPGIVHRLDKETSGLMAVAKSDRAHQGLAAQLHDRSLTREYLALVVKVPTPLKGHVQGTIGRDPRNRLKMAMNVRNGREALTHYHVQKAYGSALSLVACKLETGRTHQIRVHMQSIGHMLIGDTLYGPQPTAVRALLKKESYDADDIEEIIAFPRQALHAAKISFVHPVTEEVHSYTATLPDDFANMLKLLDK